MSLERGTCTVAGCDRPHKARGYCSAHYQHYLRGIPIKVVLRQRDPNPPPECTEAGCQGEVVGRGLCRMHYARFLRHGHTMYRDRKRPAKMCSMPECDSILYAKDMCHVHWLRGRKLMSKYGITTAQYAALEDAQGGVCAICKGDETRTNWRSSKSDALCVDHDHKTGKVRGLLCDNCNRALGLFRDDPVLLGRAVAFMERHKLA